MSNTAYVTTRKNLKPTDVYEALQEINLQKFEGMLSIKQNSHSSWNVIVSQDKNNQYGVYLWIDSKRKISISHPHGGDWYSWFMCRIQNELGFKFRGVLSDSGIEERWEPDRRYDSYIDWIKGMSPVMWAKHRPMLLKTCQYGIPKSVLRISGMTPELLKCYEVVDD